MFYRYHFVVISLKPLTKLHRSLDKINILDFRAKQNLKEEKYENIIDDCTQEIEQNPDTSVGHLARYII